MSRVLVPIRPAYERVALTAAVSVAPRLPLLFAAGGVVAAGRALLRLVH
jgi:hypothetical protein